MTVYTRSVIRRARTLATILAAAAALLFLAVEPVAAECNPPGADPSFRKAVPYAARILVGTVVAVAADDLNAGDGTSYRFTVAVERTLRGPATATQVVNRLETGACVRWLSAANGDRIALALDAHASDPTVPTNMAAWLSGTPPEPSAYETVTLGEVLDLARTPKPPDTSTSPGDDDPRRLGPLQAFAMFAVASLVSWLWMRTTGRSRPR